MYKIGEAIGYYFIYSRLSAEKKNLNSIFRLQAAVIFRKQMQMWYFYKKSDNL